MLERVRKSHSGLRLLGECDGVGKRGQHDPSAKDSDSCWWVCHLPQGKSVTPPSSCLLLSLCPSQAILHKLVSAELSVWSGVPLESLLPLPGCTPTWPGVGSSLSSFSGLIPSVDPRGARDSVPDAGASCQLETAE